MHAMDEYMNLIIYGNDKSSYCNPAADANTAELIKIRQIINNGINELKSLHETRDRVDISLKEYEELKRINKDLLDRLRHAERIFSKLEIAADEIPHIIPESVKWYSTEHYDCGPMIRKRRFRIEFDLEEWCR